MTEIKTFFLYLIYMNESNIPNDIFNVKKTMHIKLRYPTPKPRKISLIKKYQKKISKKIISFIKKIMKYNINLYYMTTKIAIIGHQLFSSKTNKKCEYSIRALVTPVSSIDFKNG